MKVFPAFLMVGLAAVLLAGCVTRIESVDKKQAAAPSQSKPTAAPTTAASASSAAPKYDQHITMDPALNNFIRLLRVQTSKSGEGFLKVQFDVQNLTGVPRMFRYQIDWFDKDATSLPMASMQPPPWMLLSHEISTMAVTSPTPAAKDFHITFAAPAAN